MLRQEVWVAASCEEDEGCTFKSSWCTDKRYGRRHHAKKMKGAPCKSNWCTDKRYGWQCHDAKTKKMKGEDEEEEGCTL